jgi:hypothetical protein
VQLPAALSPPAVVHLPVAPVAVPLAGWPVLLARV